MKTFDDLKPGEIFYSTNLYGLVQYEFIRKSESLDLGLFIRKYTNYSLEEVDLKSFKKFYKNYKNAFKNYRKKLLERIQSLKKFKKENIPYKNFNELIIEKEYFYTDIEDLQIKKVRIIGKEQDEIQNYVYFIFCQEKKVDFWQWDIMDKGIYVFFDNENDAYALLYEWLQDYECVSKLEFKEKNK